MPAKGNTITPVAQRFARKVNVTPGCWEWTGYKDRDGYGVLSGVKLDNGLTAVRAHRLAYILVFGPIPAGLVPDHTCRNRGCVNPYDLELVTVKENTLRGDGPTAMNARKTHCIHGHLLDTANTYITPTGRRNCRKCRSLATARYNRKVGV